MKVLSKSLRYSRHLNKLELSGNRLSSFGTSKLFKSLNINKELSNNLKTINLSENKIGSSNIDELIQFVNEPKCILEELNIFGNLLGDKNIIKFQTFLIG